jgi:hypothetical protein
VHWRWREVSLSRGRQNYFPRAPLPVEFLIPPMFLSPAYLWRRWWLHIRSCLTTVAIQDGFRF